MSRVTREQEFDVQESALFLRGRLHEGLYCGRKGKRYAIEVITIAKKLPLDDLKNIKDSNKDKKQKVILKRVLKLKENQGYISVLLAVRAKKQL